MSKKIIYIANIRLPTERAHGLQIMKTCEAIKKAGAEIELWVAARQNHLKEDPFSFYGVKTRFPIKKIPVFDKLASGRKSAFYVEVVSFLVFLYFFLLRAKGDFVIYTRDEAVLFLIFLTGRKIFWESHMTFRSKILVKTRAKKLAGTITISQSLKNLIVEKYKLNPAKLAVAHDAVDLEKFSKIIPKTEARQRLGLPLNKKIVVYTGSLFKQKGVFILLEAAGFLKADWLFVIVGGGEKELAKVREFLFSQNITNAILTGYVPYKEISVYLAAADILALPNSNLDVRTSLFTSPLKLFEYMAAGRPIAASATPTIKEVLNENNGVLVEPDNPRALKEAFLRISENQEWAGDLAKKAREDVGLFTWQKRAEIILNHINQLWV